MTAPQVITANRVRFHRTRALTQVLQTVLVIAAASPLALLGTEGVLGVAAACYALLWAALVVPVAGACFVLLIDPISMVLGKPALFLPALLARAATQQPPADVRRILQVLRVIALVSWWINPLSNVLIAAYVVAARWRPILFLAAAKQAAELKVAAARSVNAPDATSELVRPAARVAMQVERKLELAMSC